MKTYFALRPGDMILLDGQHAKVKSVNESSALVEVPRPARSFTTTFGETITLQPRPALVRISPNSEVPILHRPTHDQRHDLYNGFGQSSQ